MREDLEKALKGLSPKQGRAVRLRFGLDGTPPMSLAEAAEVMGLLREGVRQIEKGRCAACSEAKSLENG